MRACGGWTCQSVRQPDLSLPCLLYLIESQGFGLLQLQLYGSDWKEVKFVLESCRSKFRSELDSSILSHKIHAYCALNFEMITRIPQSRRHFSAWFELAHSSVIYLSIYQDWPSSCKCNANPKCITAVIAAISGNVFQIESLKQDCRLQQNRKKKS